MLTEFRRCFGARLLLFWKKPFHLAWVWRQQPISFATPEHGIVFGHDIESIGVEHHRLLRFFNELQDFGCARFAQPWSDGPNIGFLLEQATI